MRKKVESSCELLNTTTQVVDFQIKILIKLKMDINFEIFETDVSSCFGELKFYFFLYKNCLISLSSVPKHPSASLRLNRLRSIEVGSLTYA